MKSPNSLPTILFLATAVLCRAEPPVAIASGVVSTEDGNNLEATYESAKSLLKPGAGESELRKGFALMQEAAAKDHLAAIAGLAYLYSAGLGVAKDPAEAAKWLNKAATRGHAISQYNLGKLLIADEIPLVPEATDRDAQHAQGVEWLRKAADQGQNEARATYGIILMRGDSGAKPDPTAASRYLILAAEAGNAEAMNTLGTMYQVGNGIGYDLAAAERSFRQAAMLGHVKAQANLGEHLLNPTAPDPARRTEALAWLYLAEQAKDPVAMKILQNIGTTLSPRDEAAARAKADSLRKEIVRSTRK